MLLFSLNKTIILNVLLKNERTDVDTELSFTFVPN